MMSVNKQRNDSANRDKINNTFNHDKIMGKLTFEEGFALISRKIALDTR